MKLDFTGFFADVTNFLRGGRVLGVDIGTSSVKLVEVSKSRGVFRLSNYGILETENYLDHPNQALQSETVDLLDTQAAYLLRTMVGELKLKTKRVLMSIPIFTSFTTSLEMPMMSDTETAKAIRFQARQLIPLPRDKVSIDWTRVGEFERDGRRRQRILLIGIPNEVVETYRRVVKMAGLDLVALELESLALVRALLGQDTHTVLVVDIGAEMTSVLVVEQGVLKIVGRVDNGGLYLTRGLSKSLGVSMRRAEELKRRRGLLGKGGELELSTLLLSFLDVIIQEVGGVKSEYERGFSRRVQKLVVTGGGANMLGVSSYFSDRLGLSLYKPPVFLDVAYDTRLEPVVENLSAGLSVALGLAKRYFL